MNHENISTIKAVHIKKTLTTLRSINFPFVWQVENCEKSIKLLSSNNSCLNYIYNTCGFKCPILVLDTCICVLKKT